MRILALDTALAHCSAAVFDTDLDRRLGGESLPMERGHAEALMPLIVRVMDQAECEFAQLDRVAVTVGPGSFTGLRVGIAAARGIARHGHLFLQLFGGARAELRIGAYVDLDAARSALAETEGPVHLAGPAADMLAGLWPAGRAEPIVHRTGPAPDIDWVARLGAAASAETAPAKPLYLRAPDARPQNAARLPHQ